MEPVTVEKYFSTIGLNAFVPQLGKRKLVRIAHDRLTDGNWKVYVESGHNLSQIKACGVKYLSNEEIQELFSDGNEQEFQDLASLFGIEV